jgi:hypothetical protein
MKIRMSYAISLVCLSAMVLFAQAAGLEGTWVTEGFPAVEAAKKAGKSLNGMAEGTRIKFKVDEKKGKVSGTITQLNTDKEYNVEDGKLTDKTFTFKSVESVPVGFGNSQRGGGGGGFGNATPAAPSQISWKGELTDANTVTLTRLDANGAPAGMPLVLKRAGK